MARKQAEQEEEASVQEEAAPTLYEVRVEQTFGEIILTPGAGEAQSWWVRNSEQGFGIITVEAQDLASVLQFVPGASVIPPATPAEGENE